MDSLASPSINATLGTVWCVKETLWQERISDYDQHSKRKQHFGLSILRLPPMPFSSIGYLPMLHGSSEKSAKRGVCEETKLDFFSAQGLSRERGSGYRTFFGHLAPAELPTEELSDVPLSDNPHEIDLEWEIGGKRIRPNADKRRLSKNEKVNLTDWLKRKTIW